MKKLPGFSENAVHLHHNVWLDLPDYTATKHPRPIHPPTPQNMIRTFHRDVVFGRHDANQA